MSDCDIGFGKYFETVRADTEELRTEVYRLRYQVYCLETHFENPDDFPDGIERDEYDASAQHYLVRHIDSGQFAATTRLILPDQRFPGKPFALERHCSIDSEHTISETQRATSAEVSRFCVSKNFKRRAGESGTLAGISSGQPVPSFSREERRAFPDITLALISCLVRLSRENNISDWYAVMEPPLIRFLTHLGIYFTVIGPLVNYHGPRTPCKINLAYMLHCVREKDGHVWNMLTNSGKFWESER